MTVAQRLQALYDHEMNFQLSCFWDGGIDWKLGDRLNGFSAEGNEDTIDKAVDELWAAALKANPRLETCQVPS